MVEQILIKFFREIDLSDPFFKSLKEDYPGFSEWFERKSSEDKVAFVQYNRAGQLQAFLFLKIENGELDDIEPIRPTAKRLKVGTFKIDAHNTKLGERFIKKITDIAIDENVDEIYVTIFNKHAGLIALLKKYGFIYVGKKIKEDVLVKSMKILRGDQLKDYPLICLRDKRKFLLSIYPKYHTKLFPDSILNNEESYKYDLVRDVSYTNSIHKIYICFMSDVASLRKGDLIAIYRTNDYQGPARYRSVITSICEVEEVKTKSDFENIEKFVEYTNAYSIFDESDLRKWYQRDNVITIKMTYNIALTKRVTRGYLLDNLGISSDIYWGFFRLSDEQFRGILEKGEINENIIID
ncbi:N-acetyltransferase [Bacteroides fragilis]|uniref:N-acetyltransferase n=1 Tax=Bacteroides fragilis TaxID=817 RepID=UPI00109D8AC6|nr:N-acetyltransferase [Bacteroides fragilis]MBG9215062.1 N-acetyltransferase [Bacteroides fragilis]MBG9225867.1 N-acetyltransferase [Bacteroides fragilis]THC61729.1 N-acetyltransferase [Bacteroides fragilis]THC69554.1 N-acetyltransferase [Bacteroides fragilis]THC83754.1 N-acetyltransferase [Bacteroides fragilis]